MEGGKMSTLNDYALDGGDTDEPTPDPTDEEECSHSKTVAGTTLVNLNHYDGDEDVTRVGRSSRFGNPYRLHKDGGDYTREESVREYRLWFAHKIGNDEEFRQAVEDLRGETIGCYCLPDACHGEVILDYLERTADEEGSA